MTSATGRPPAIRLNRRRAERLARIFGGGAPLVVRRHPQYGRNRLFLACRGGTPVAIIKQGAISGTNLGECAAYRLIGELACTLRPIFMLPRTNIIALPHVADAIDLEECARRDGAKAIDALLSVGTELLRLSLLELPPGLARMRSFLTLPIPHIDQIADTNRAVEHLIAIVQERNFLDDEAGAAVDSQLLRLAHFDLKLDNVLLVNGTALVVDWELAGPAPLGWDLASCIGAMLIAWTRDPRDRNDPAIFVPKIDFVMDAARELLRRYRSFAEHHGLPGPDYAALRAMIMMYLLDRIASEACSKPALTPIDHVILEFLSILSRARDLRDVVGV